MCSTINKEMMHGMMKNRYSSTSMDLVTMKNMRTRPIPADRRPLLNSIFRWRRMMNLQTVINECGSSHIRNTWTRPPPTKNNRNLNQQVGPGRMLAASWNSLGLARSKQYRYNIDQLPDILKWKQSDLHSTKISTD